MPATSFLLNQPINYQANEPKTQIEQNLSQSKTIQSYVKPNQNAQLKTIQPKITPIPGSVRDHLPLIQTDSAQLEIKGSNEISKHPSLLKKNIKLGTNHLETSDNCLKCMRLFCVCGISGLALKKLYKYCTDSNFLNNNLSSDKNNLNNSMLETNQFFETSSLKKANHESKVNKERISKLIGHSSKQNDLILSYERFVLFESDRENIEKIFQVL